MVGATKKKILKTTLKLVIERGFLEFSVNDLVKKMDIAKNDFGNCFESKDKLVCEAIEKFWFPYLNDIIRSADECDISSQKKLLKIFLKYSEVESYLKNNFDVKKFNYESIICLIIKGTENYELITQYIVEFNDRLLEKIECIIEEGKILGEILSNVDSRYTAVKILKSLQSSILIWAMNSNLNIKMLFEIDFKHLWNTIILK